MKLTSILCIALLSAGVESAGIVGYVHQPMAQGDNLINNPLDDGTLLLSNLIPTAPIGTTVSLWNPLIEGYGLTSTFISGSWTADLTLSVGTGALLNTSTLFTNTWVGGVLTGDGIAASGPLYPPSPYSGPDGTYLLGTITPVSVTGEDVFLWVLGRGPNVGEKVTTLDTSSQIYTTTTYLGSSAWDNGIPSLDVAESAFFTIPEPSSLAMIVLVSGCAAVVKRWFAV